MGMIVHNLFVVLLLLELVFILGEVIVVTRQRDKLFPHQYALQTTLPFWYVCADLCSRIKMCKSMNFITRTKTCQIFDVVPIEICEESLIVSNGDTFLDRLAIDDNLAGKCLAHNCNSGEICIEQETGYICHQIENKKKKMFTPKGCETAGYIYNSTTNTCIKTVPSTGMNWYDARALCLQDGGDLISISSKLKWNFVLDHVQNAGTHWIGLKCKDWVNGIVFVNNLDINVDVNNYDSKFSNDGPSCGLLRPKSSSAQLQDESCLKRFYNSCLCELVIE